LIDKEVLVKLLEISEENKHLFSLKHNNRAKRLIFKPSIRHGFEIVLPGLYDDNWVLNAIAKNRSKIDKNLTEIKQAREALKPVYVDLPIIGGHWQVIYKKGVNEERYNHITEISSTIEVTEDLENVFAAPMLLQEWLHEKALEYLPKHLDTVALQLGISYNKVRVKRQRTRWGSCSAKRNINLNRNLMFMPFEVVDYVLHHEIVHLKFLDHSSKFWNEVERLFPNYRIGRQQLKHLGDNKVPEWAVV